MTDGQVDAAEADRPSREPDRPSRLIIDIDSASVLTIVAVGVGALGVLAVLQQIPVMLTRVLIGVVLALALDPVVVRVQRRLAWHRATAVGLVGSALGLAFIGVLVVLGPAAIEQASSLRSDLPATIEEAYSWPVIGERLAEENVAERVDDAIERLPTELDDDQIAAYAESLLGGALATVIVLVTAVAVMLDGETMVARFRAVVPAPNRDRADAVGRIVYRTFGNYFAGSLFVAILNGLVILAVALALGVPLAPLAGLWSTLTNLIPQIGGFLGGSFLVLLALTEGPLTAVIALAVFLVYQNLENNLIQPAVVGRAVNLTPPTTMLAALIGGAVAGVPGALVATPVIGVAKVLYLRDAADGVIDLEGIEQPGPDEPIEDDGTVV